MVAQLEQFTSEYCMLCAVDGVRNLWDSRINGKDHEPETETKIPGTMTEVGGHCAKCGYLCFSKEQYVQ